MPGVRIQPLTCAFPLLAMSLWPSSAFAGEVFGTISEQGRARANLQVTIQCEGGPSTSGQTDQFGAYRLFVNFEGTCRIRVPGVEPAAVRSSRESQRYNLEILRVPGAAPSLRRR